ncbi:ribonuclease E/G [Azospirillum sp. TSO22-1]|uniref:Rne/Rng family ribonuclease n=1 Tax=Azospirillum sp. TSO22-1 TaxID=716789 RepID=UPI000D62247B|nr:ribonuclease E/G [Azospirillum sp. TSO22-1]PWC56817.1 ribonuclease E [Azospirillum sp. TSO22-1]
MAKRMLVDATHPEETRVVVVNGNRLEELDFEIATRKQLKGNIYLAKVTRVEPSLQAAFVEYGGNRHGFLAFSEIHPDYYRIPVADREALLAEEERRYREDEREAESRERGGRRNRRAMAEAAESTAEIQSEIQENLQEDLRRGDVIEHDSPMPTPIAEAEAEAATEFEEPAAGYGEDNGGAYAYAESETYTREAQPESNGEAASDENGAAHEPSPTSESVDVVGGDEVEDSHRRRARPLRSYKIQEVIKRRQIMLVQVTKEERGNKGAALTTYLSLPGRYCVLMPNTGRGGGISRKITNPADRKRLKEMLSDLDIPEGMAVILRTAGLERSKQEIKRDLEYLLRLWDDIREQTLSSTAPALIYEEANLIKRSIRDIYSNDIDEIWVEGDAGYRTAKDFMRMLMPSHAKRVQPYKEEEIPLFHRYQVEPQIDAIHNPVVHLKSGGYIVINPTEALVAIDVNSGKSTRERNIEETAYKTNLEAAEEVARQLRLRDLAGLIVIDFIDMEDAKNNASVERRLKEAMKNDRARIQLGRISPFGLLELSRQRLRPSLLETNFERCAHCAGTGVVRSVESASLHVLRHIEEEGIRKRSAEITVTVPTAIALYILNQKRTDLARIETKYGFRVLVQADDTLIAPDLRLERVKAKQPGDETAPLVSADRVMAETDRVLAAEAEAEEEEDADDEAAESEAETAERPAEAVDAGENGDRRRRRRRRRRGRGEREGGEQRTDAEALSSEAESDEDEAEGDEADEGVEAGERGEGDDADSRKKRRRGKRGGRRRSRQRELAPGETAEGAEGAEDGAEAPAADVPETPAPAAKQRVRALVPPKPVPPAPALEPIDFDWILTGEPPPAETPAEAPAEEAPAAAAPEAAAPEVAADTAVEAPKKKRPSRSKKAAAEPVAEAPAEAAPEAEAPKPKKRPSRSKKAATEPAAEAVPAPAVEAAPEAEAPKPKKRPSRSKKAAEPAEAPAVTLSEPVVEEVAAVAAPEAVPEAVPAEAAPTTPTAEENAAARAAETVNPTPEKPKRGWWNR